MKNILFDKSKYINSIDYIKIFLYNDFMLMYVIVGVVIAFAVLLCFCLAIASFSFDNYADKLKENDERRNSYGITTLQYVGEINSKYFNDKLSVMRCPEFQDHYRTGVVALSDRTMSSNSLASLAIISHEIGHAKQDDQGKLNNFWRLKKIGKISGFLFMPSLLAGAVFSLLYVFNVLPQVVYLVVGIVGLCLGVFIFVFSIIMKYKEIKIEKEATVFAIEFLKEILTDPEIKHCDDFLKSARLTYWASLFRSLLSWTFLTNKEKMF